MAQGSPRGWHASRERAACLYGDVDVGWRWKLTVAGIAFVIAFLTSLR